jgi:hypothetical protein
MTGLVEFLKTFTTPKAGTSIKGKLAIILLPCTLFALPFSLLVLIIEEYAFGGKTILEWLAANGEGITGCVYIFFVIMLVSILLFIVSSLLKLFFGNFKSEK